jgi:hypothetical protein
MNMLLSFPVILLAVVLLLASVKILREYERAVVFQLGRFWKVKGPGLFILIPIVQQMVRVDLRTIVMDVPAQDLISHDNVSVKVNAVVYFRVVDPQKAIINVEHFYEATSQLAQTTLRSVLGQHDLDEMLAEREKLNHDIRTILDTQTDAWGIKVANVEIKDVDINEGDGARDRAPGRSRAPAPRQDHPCRGRTPGSHSTRRCRAPAGGRSTRNPAALPADPDGDRGGEEFDDRLPAAYRRDPVVDRAQGVATALPSLRRKQIDLVDPRRPREQAIGVVHQRLRDLPAQGARRVRLHRRRCRRSRMSSGPNGTHTRCACPAPPAPAAVRRRAARRLPPPCRAWLPVSPADRT